MFTNEFISLNTLSIGETYIITGVLIKRPNVSDNYGTKPFPNKVISNDLILQVVELKNVNSNKLNCLNDMRADYWLADENIEMTV